jgi:hypothetical protein
MDSESRTSIRDSKEQGSKWSLKGKSSNRDIDATRSSETSPQPSPDPNEALRELSDRCQSEGRYRFATNDDFSRLTKDKNQGSNDSIWNKFNFFDPYDSCDL